MFDLNHITGFDWGDGNHRKSVDKQAVTQAGAESIFFNHPLLLVEDAKHGGSEQRLNALGRTARDRFLHITFTLRQNATLNRIISARDMNRKERNRYEQA